MHSKITPRVILIAVLLTACDNASGPDAKIETVDMLLAKICELAAECPGISSSADEVDDCPLGIRSELSQSQLTELERFSTYSKAEQDRVLQCIGTAICGRFAGSVANVSDSDLMEPYADCLSDPGTVRVAAGSFCPKGLPRAP
jgi:hypothetical protein